MNLNNIIAKQSKMPIGLLGIITANLMNKKNTLVYDWVIDLLNVKKNDKILEVGFASGAGIKKVSTIASNGLTAGIDISETMVREGCKRNSLGIRNGIIELKKGSTSSIPYDSNVFDKAFAINVIYFWDEPLKDLKELFRILKKDGIVCIYVFEQNDLKRHGFAQSDLYNIYDNKKIIQLLKEAGFKKIRTEIKTNIYKNETGICFLAKK